MNLPPVLAGKLHVLAASQVGEGWAFTRYVLARRRGRVRVANRRRGYDPAGRKKEDTRHPWVLIVHGAGIVSKPWSAADESARRIADRPAEFLSVVEAGRLVFMRRAAYDELTARLAAAGLAVLSTRLTAAPVVTAEVRAAGADHFGATLAANNLLRPGAESSRVLTLLARRLMLPVLALVLAIVAAGYALQRRDGRMLERQRVELSAFENAASRDEERRQVQQSLQALLLAPPALPPAYLADRVAAGVSAGVSLTALEIHPLAGRIQPGRPPQSAVGQILVGGRAAETAPVTAFADTLGRLDFVRSLKLLSMTRERAGGYTFQIEIGL